MDIQKALVAIEKYHQTPLKGVDTRYLSWHHCYSAFHKNRLDVHNDSEKLEFLCLHLAFYLASWGMLRNSFLLNKDYKIHKKLTVELCGFEYESLFEQPEKPQIELVIKAGITIRNAYAGYSVTDTLVTKILLGVFGCAPAYDRYFKYTARKHKVCTGHFTASSMKRLWDYYGENKEAFDSLQTKLCSEEFRYPPMKLMDMCMWQIGFDESAAEK